MNGTRKRSALNLNGEVAAWGRNAFCGLMETKFEGVPMEPQAEWGSPPNEGDLERTC